MSQRFERRGNGVPPDGWRYSVGANRFTNDNILTLEKEVIAYCRANTITVVDDVAQAIIDETASSLAPAERDRYFRMLADTGTVKPIAAPTILEGAKLLLGIEKDRALGTFQLVGLERAYRRATICVGCPHNSVNVNRRMDRTLLARLGATRIRQIRQEAQKRGKLPPLPKTKDDKLGVCMVCSCSLKDAVWFSPETHRDFVEAHGSKLPVACWKRREIEAGGSEIPVAEPTAEPLTELPEEPAVPVAMVPPEPESLPLAPIPEPEPPAEPKAKRKTAKKQFEAPVPPVADLDADMATDLSSAEVPDSPGEDPASVEAPFNPFE